MLPGWNGEGRMAATRESGIGGARLGSRIRATRRRELRQPIAIFFLERSLGRTGARRARRTAVERFRIGSDTYQSDQVVTLSRVVTGCRPGPASGWGGAEQRSGGTHRAADRAARRDRAAKRGAPRGANDGRARAGAGALDGGRVTTWGRVALGWLAEPSCSQNGAVCRVPRSIGPPRLQSRALASVEGCRVHRSSRRRALTRAGERVSEMRGDTARGNGAAVHWAAASVAAETTAAANTAARKRPRRGPTKPVCHGDQTRACSNCEAWLVATPSGLADK